MADWSRTEVEATVADYFDMLDHQEQGLNYNKTAHRRALAGMLDGRSDGAIERKHQNISAALIELGFVCIDGYKPLGNYQQLLFDVVAERLANSPQLVAAVRQRVSAPAPVPTLDDILASLVEAPTPDPERAAYRRVLARERRQVRQGVDYLAESGRERLIEVKTTGYGASTPFYVTRREVTLSREAAGQFHLYRAFDFRQRPRLFLKAGPLEQSFGLEPSQFVATIR